MTVTALTDAEYVLSSVALGIDEYYAGVGEAPGVWTGNWSLALGLEGMVAGTAAVYREVLGGLGVGPRVPCPGGEEAAVSRTPPEPVP